MFHRWKTVKKTKNKNRTRGRAVIRLLDVVEVDLKLVNFRGDKVRLGLFIWDVVTLERKRKKKEKKKKLKFTSSSSTSPQSLSTLLLFSRFRKGEWAGPSRGRAIQWGGEGEVRGREVKPCHHLHPPAGWLLLHYVVVFTIPQQRWTNRLTAGVTKLISHGIICRKHEANLQPDQCLCLASLLKWLWKHWKHGGNTADWWLTVY